MSRTKKFMGIGDHEVYYEAEIENGKVKGFNDYAFIDGDRMSCGNDILCHWGWTHDIEIDGTEYKSGMLESELPTPSDEARAIFEGTYQCDVSFCDECNIGHDTEDHNIDVVIDDGALYCKGCFDSLQDSEQDSEQDEIMSKISYKHFRKDDQDDEEENNFSDSDNARFKVMIEKTKWALLNTPDCQGTLLELRPFRTTTKPPQKVA